MVRRVGFGNTPAPEQRRRSRKPAVNNAVPAPSKPIPNVQSKTQKSSIPKLRTDISPIKLIFKTLKIVTAISIAIQVDSNIVTVIMLWFAGKEIYSIFRKKPTIPDPVL